MFRGALHPDARHILVAGGQLARQLEPPWRAERHTWGPPSLHRCGRVTPLAHERPNARSIGTARNLTPQARAETTAPLSFFCKGAVMRRVPRRSSGPSAPASPQHIGLHHRFASQAGPWAHISEHSSLRTSRRSQTARRPTPTRSLAELDCGGRSRSQVCDAGQLQLASAESTPYAIRNMHRLPRHHSPQCQRPLRAVVVESSSMGRRPLPNKIRAFYM